MANAHQVRLEKKVTDVSKALAHLSSGDDLRKLILLIRKPGWTTPAEFAFAFGIADAMLAQVQVLGDLRTALVRGGGLVASNPMPGKARRKAA